MSGWNIAKVTKMHFIFYRAHAFKQQLWWNVDGKEVGNMFNGSPGSIGCDWSSKFVFFNLVCVIFYIGLVVFQMIKFSFWLLLVIIPLCIICLSAHVPKLNTFLCKSMHVSVILQNIILRLENLLYNQETPVYILY